MNFSSAAKRSVKPIAPASGHDEDMEDGVDEPTREFMPISRERATTSSREIEPPASLFDDDEDEEEIEPPISRRAQRLQRKEARLDEEYEDEDDYDDEDEDEPAPKKTLCSYFSPPCLR